MTQRELLRIKRNLLRLLIDESDARGNLYRAQLSILEGRKSDLAVNRRMLKEREKQHADALAKLETALSASTDPEKELLKSWMPDPEPKH